MKRLAILVVLSMGTLLALAACSPQSAEPQDTPPMKTQPVETAAPDAMEKTIYVAPTLVDCVGVAPQKCMQVKESPEAEYTLFYGQIEGFEYQEGNEYVLLVREEQIENPPADAPDRKWVLVSLVGQTPLAAAPGVEPAAQTYILDWYLDDSGEKTPILTGTQITLQVDQDQISGSAGCNSYSAQFELDGDQISIGPAISTMMACPEPVMQQESAYLAALGDAATVSMAEDGLTFATPGRIMLSTTGPTSLVDALGMWSHNNGKGDHLSGWHDDAVHLRYGNLELGCNNYTAPSDGWVGSHRRQPPRAKCALSRRA
jgi:heat shock protein HslJ